MIQHLIIIALFLAAVVYLGSLLRKSFSLKHGSCPKGCGCGKIDFKKLEAEIEKRKIPSI